MSTRVRMANNQGKSINNTAAHIQERLGSPWSMLGDKEEQEGRLLPAPCLFRLYPRTGNWHRSSFYMIPSMFWGINTR